MNCHAACFRGYPGKVATPCKAWQNKSDGKVYFRFFPSYASVLSNSGRLSNPILVQSGMLGIPWPRGFPGIAADLSGIIDRGIVLRKGLEDEKVCAVDEALSHRKFAHRVTDRI